MSFKKPDADQDSKFIEDEESRSGGPGESLYDTQYKPKSGTSKDPINNKIRVLGAKGDSDGTYYLRIGRHFFKHDDRTEMFICPKETIGEPCPACEVYADLREKKDESADKYRPQIRGVMNVLDRGVVGKSFDLDSTKVQVYFAPIKAVCSRIVNLVHGQGPMADIFDEFDENFKVTKPGRDFILVFNKNADPGEMYMVYPVDMSPLGTPEQVERWYSEMKDLTVEGLFGGMISYEDAGVKMYGSAEERQALRDRWQAEAEKQKSQQAETKPKAEEPKPEPTKKVEEPKTEEPKVEPKDELKISKKSAAEEDAEAKVKRMIEASRAAQKAAKK